MLYIFIFCSFFRKKIHKRQKHPQIVVLYSAEVNLKYVSHAAAQQPKY